MGCTGKLRLFLIDAPPGPKVSYFKVSYFKDKVRLPAEVLGTAKPPFLWNLVLYPAKRGAVKQILTSSIDSVRIQPLRAPRNTKEPFTIQPFVQIRVVRGSRLGDYTGLGDSLVHQQNGNVIPNRINAVALSALEALPFVLKREWLLADRANQHVE